MVRYSIWDDFSLMQLFERGALFYFFKVSLAAYVTLPKDKGRRINVIQIDHLGSIVKYYAVHPFTFRVIILLSCKTRAKHGIHH